jgi:membrane-bound lytic murein transglycosylase B
VSRQAGRHGAGAVGVPWRDAARVRWGTTKERLAAVRFRPVALTLTGAGLVGVCVLNVVAASADPTDPVGRLPLVDPWAATEVAAEPAGRWLPVAEWQPEAPEPAAAPDLVAVPDPASAQPADNVVAAPQPAPAPAPPSTLAAWAAQTSSATGIPARALVAYGEAALRLADEVPACRLGWVTLAGIGLVESNHGRSLGEDGRPAVPIVGPALDGRPGVAAIRATAQSTAWHGDPSWDHAVGPMQFIPSTWRTWGADGDGDGEAHPQDIDDAALAAGRYLCAGSRDLGTPDGWRAGVFSYNHSDAYVEKVLAAAARYAGRVA